MVIALSILIARRLLKMSDYPLVAPRVFFHINGENRIQTGLILYVKMNLPLVTTRHGFLADQR